MLVEAIVAVAIVAVCVTAALGAVAAVTHARARALASARLMRTAQNVLVDLRAATVYDPGQLAGLAGTSTAFDAFEPASDGSRQPVHITVAVAQAEPAGTYVATVGVRVAGQAGVVLTQTLAAEAPAPGSTIAAAPAAPPQALPGDGSTGPIRL